MHPKHNYRIASIILICILHPKRVGTAFPSFGSKLTIEDVQCISNNSELLSVNECFVNINKALASFNVFIEAVDVYANVKILRKVKNKYVPFVIDWSLDWCTYGDNPDNEVLRKLYAAFQIRKYSNIIEKCPMKLKPRYLNIELNNGSTTLPFTLPIGHYQTILTATINNVVYGVVKYSGRLS